MKLTNPRGVPRPFASAMLISLGLVIHGVATAQRPSIQISGSGAGRSPVSTQPVGSRVPAVQAPGQFKAWEGFTTTNYLNTEQYVFTPPIASTAAGPVNIINIVNRRISMYDNPNAIVPLSPSGTRVPQVLSPTSYIPTSEALLDAWLGETVLNQLCPTGRDSNISCLVDNASVRYDQMHGRFLVLMTVTDTGVETLGNIVTKPRKASWVLLISKFSQFSVLGTPGSSDVFITPTPPIGSTSGVNIANWSVYYGNALNALGTDGFGNVTTTNTTASGPGPGNINSLPGIVPVNTTVGHDAIFDCRAGSTTGAVGPIQVAVNDPLPTKVCYFPTSARLGIDNDNIIITSAVVNVNYFIPAAPTAVPIATFAGTRVRVIKKGGGAPGVAGGLYQRSLVGTGLVAANQFAATPDLKVAGDFYDLFASPTLDNLPYTTFAGTVAFSPYTLAPIVAPLAPGQAPFCEPARVRGRASASYTNSMVPAGHSSQSYVECVVSTQNPAGLGNPDIPQNIIYVQPIVYTPLNPINLAANTNGTIPFWVSLVGNGTTGAAGMQTAFVEPFVNPSVVPQGNYLGTVGGPTGLAPPFNVGDDRVHDLIFREGHLYNARVGGLVVTALLTRPVGSPLGNAVDNDGAQNDGVQQLGPAADIFQVNGNPLSTTVFYDVIQKLTAGPAGAIVNPVLLSKWTNTNAYAPMYDVPSNVATQGQTSPINVFPWLEKLFVATTYPQLTASDPRANLGTQGFITGNNIATCVASNVIPNIVGGVSTSTLGYPGLYDMRCGNDVFDNRQNFRDPITGQLVINIPNNPARLPITPGVRGGASTDPNNGSLWNFGLYATHRFGGVGNGGQLGSYIANYDLSFPTSDPYGNNTTLFADCNSLATCPFFVQVQTASQLGLVAAKADGTVGLNDQVTRREMAKLVILSMMDELAITDYLNATGGCTTSFADVAAGCAGGQPVASVTNTSGAANGWRYIETLRRKKITTGCLVNDAIANFCPADFLTRGQMAVFIIRAKLGNVYPSVISGCPGLNGPACPGIVAGDGFGVTVGATPYFTDVPSTNPFFLYIQKMYELRISNGTAPPPSVPLYSDGQTLPRGQLLAFIVRAFFF